jgi:GDP-L-fucose synthase
MTPWSYKRVLVTGGNGFLGRQLLAELNQRGYLNVCAPSSREYDLTQPNEVERLMVNVRPSLVIHLAARVGGIGANQQNPGSFFYANAIMGIHLMEEARRCDVEKFICLGTVCAYPKYTPVPFHEDDLWNGYPEETNAPYGLAKKMLLVQAQAYRQQYGFNAVYLVPVNLYGPGDNFDLDSSHVIPALIRKCVEAKNSGAKKIRAWGSGGVSREFLFVADAARAIAMAAECYNEPVPVNIGSGEEISIRELANMIASLSGFRGEIEWETSRPDGQPRRRLNTSRALANFGFRATTSLDEGLRQTIDWYETHTKRHAATATRVPRTSNPSASCVPCTTSADHEG